MIKKILIINLLFIIMVNNISIVFADDEDDELYTKNINDVIETSGQITNSPNIDSRYAVVLERNTGIILYGKNEKSKTKMASTTKIMTAIVVIENSDLNDIVTVSSKAALTGGSKLKISKGNKIKIIDLLYGLMLRSGNDAAVALAEHVGGSIQGFADLMNKKAKEIGLENTHFETPHGLDSQEHYTTPYELAILTKYALNNETFKKIVGTKSCTINVNGIDRQINNTNELLGNLYGVYGVKTGFTNGAGRCLVTAIKRDNLDIICVVLGADTKKIRTTDSIKLIEYTFNTFTNIKLEDKIEEEFKNWLNINSKRINIKKGKKNSINLKLEEYNLKEYTVNKILADKIEIKIDCNLNLIAPINKEQKIGELSIYYNNSIIGNICILADECVDKKKIIDYIQQIILNYNTYIMHKL